MKPDAKGLLDYGANGLLPYVGGARGLKLLANGFNKFDVGIGKSP